MELGNEVWKTLTDYPIYEISKEGTIRNKGTGKKLKQCPVKNNLLISYIRWANKTKRIFIHRELAKAFIPNPKNLPFVMHLNNNSLDNRIENLCWADNSQRSKKAYQTLIANGGALNGHFPFNHRHNSPISEEAELMIMLRLMRGEIGVNLAREYNVSAMSISRINKKLQRLLKEKTVEEIFGKR